MSKKKSKLYLLNIKKLSNEKVLTTEKQQIVQLKNKLL